MLINATALKHFDVDASDGPVGTVTYSYFDDRAWAITHLAIDTRAWVGGRDVIVGTDSVRRIEGPREKFELALSRQRVDNAGRVRSMREVVGYHINARSETFGHLEDMLFDPETWSIRYLVVDTRNWWPGPPVLVSPEWVHEIDWTGRTISFDIEAERIKASPQYDPAMALTRDYEIALHQHYSRRGYWG